MNDVQAGAGPARSQTTRTQQVCRIESAYTKDHRLYAVQQNTDETHSKDNMRDREREV